MPVNVTFLEDGGVRLEGSGCITFGDITEANRQIYRTPEETRKITYQICDYSAATELALTSEQVKTLARQDVEAATINPAMLIAVVGQRDFVFGMLRMWGIYADPSPAPVNVFRTVGEAQAWVASRRNEKAKPRTAGPDS